MIPRREPRMIPRRVFSGQLRIFRVEGWAGEWVDGQVEWVGELRLGVSGGPGEQACGLGLSGRRPGYR